MNDAVKMEKRSKISRCSKSSTSPGREKTSRTKLGAKKKTNVPKKQTRINGTNPYGAFMTPDEINEFPNIIPKKDLIKELHTLWECMGTPSSTTRWKISAYIINYLSEDNQMQLVTFGIFQTDLKYNHVLPTHLKAIQHGL